MVKFVIGLIALIFVALAVYVFTNKNTENISKGVVTQQTVKKELTEEKVKVKSVVQALKEKKSSVKIKSPKVVSKETTGKNLTVEGSQDSMADYSKIGEGLTLEGIQNSNASEEEKELMLDDLAAYQSYRNRDNPSISEEEGMKALINSFN